MGSSSTGIPAARAGDLAAIWVRPPLPCRTAHELRALASLEIAQLGCEHFMARAVSKSTPGAAGCAQSPHLTVVAMLATSLQSVRNAVLPEQLPQRAARLVRPMTDRRCTRTPARRHCERRSRAPGRSCIRSIFTTAPALRRDRPSPNQYDQATSPTTSMRTCRNAAPHRRFRHRGDSPIRRHRSPFNFRSIASRHAGSAAWGGVAQRR